MVLIIMCIVCDWGYTTVSKN